MPAAAPVDNVPEVCVSLDDAAVLERLAATLMDVAPASAFGDDEAVVVTSEVVRVRDDELAELIEDVDVAPRSAALSTFQYVADAVEPPSDAAAT